MGRRSEHTRSEQREMTLAAAELLIMREGVAGLSTRKLASAVGYTAGNLYLLFSNQDELLAAVNERTAAALHAALIAQRQLATEQSTRLEQLSLAYMDFAHAQPNRWRLLFEHRPASGVVPTTEYRLQGLLGLVLEELAGLLPGLDDGALRTAATAVCSSVHGVACLSLGSKLYGANQMARHELGRRALAAMLYGLQSGA